MATIGLKVKLEDTALGPVMILLKKTPGVLGWEIEMDTLAGPAPKVPGKSLGGMTLELFVAADGASVSVGDVARVIGGTRGRAHGALNGLSKQKLIRTVSKGTWILTAKGRALLGLAPLKLLPAPAAKAKPVKATKGKTNGHAKPKVTPKGVGPGKLHEVLKAHGPLPAAEIVQAMAGTGLSQKAVYGVMFRGKTAGTLKVLADGRYALTANGEG